MLAWIAAGLSVGGNVLVIMKSRWGYAMWFLANCYWIVHNWLAGEWALAVLFVVYAALSLVGWAAWSLKQVICEAVSEEKQRRQKAKAVSGLGKTRRLEPWELN